MTKNVNVVCIMSSSRECGQKLTTAEWCWVFWVIPTRGFGLIPFKYYEKCVPQYWERPSGDPVGLTT